MNGMIELRGVRVHNLREIDVDIPRQQLTVISGVSGAGKSSLAFDTLYAEGQRRYAQSFSTYARQFLERLEPPDADSIGDLPPAVAIRPSAGRHGQRATVGTVTEILDDLRLLFARLGHVVCPDCNLEARPASPATIVRELSQLPSGTRFQLAFEWAVPAKSTDLWTILQHSGFSRAIVGGRTVPVSGELGTELRRKLEQSPTVRIVLDRLVAGRVDLARLAESLETSFASGNGECMVLVEEGSAPAPGSTTEIIDERTWTVRQFSSDYRCPSCRRQFTPPEPRLFSFASALGACPECEGLGSVTGPGTRERETCPECRGTRLNSDALAVRVDDRHIAAWSAQTVDTFRETLRAWSAALPAADGGPVAEVLARIAPRCHSLQQLGLGHLTIDRSAATLSAGELRRVHLTAALGSQLVNTLFVIDEPSAGLHPRETGRLIAELQRLRDAGNTVVVVEHDPALMRQADWLIDIGPGGGPDGGRVLYQGPPSNIARQAPDSPTAHALDHAKTIGPGTAPRVPTSRLTLHTMECRNLRELTVTIPLGVLCVVTGISGSGKTSLVRDTLVPAVQQSIAARPGTVPSASKRRPAADWELPGTVKRVEGGEEIQEVVLIDQRPALRQARSTPASLAGILSGLRELFAQTSDAQVRNYTPLHFSLQANSPGRCPTCQGLGHLDVDLQFLPDLHLPCPDCRGARYRPEILEIRCRGLSVSEVLALSVRDAFGFLRGLPQLQRRIKALKDVGLDYLSLGQPATTLSDGELQRLKLAAHLGRSSRLRTLFVLDESTIGLHPADVARLVEVFSLLVNSGHSLVVAEHHPQVLASADWVIELGPEAGTRGGKVMREGPRAS